LVALALAWDKGTGALSVISECHLIKEFHHPSFTLCWVPLHSAIAWTSAKALSMFWRNQWRHNDTEKQPTPLFIIIKQPSWSTSWAWKHSSTDLASRHMLSCTSYTHTFVEYSIKGFVHRLDTPLLKIFQVFVTCFDGVPCLNLHRSDQIKKIFGKRRNCTLQHYKWTSNHP